MCEDSRTGDPEFLEGICRTEPHLNIGKITRVHCNTCGGQHVHRAGPPRTRAAVAASKAARSGKDQIPRLSEYQTLLLAVQVAQFFIAWPK